METNQELLKRYTYIKTKIVKDSVLLQKMKQSSAKDDKSRFIGCLTFTILGIQSEIEDRKLMNEKSTIDLKIKKKYQ